MNRKFVACQKLKIIPESQAMPKARCGNGILFVERLVFFTHVYRCLCCFVAICFYNSISSILSLDNQQKRRQIMDMFRLIETGLRLPDTEEVESAVPTVMWMR